MGSHQLQKCLLTTTAATTNALLNHGETEDWMTIVYMMTYIYEICNALRGCIVEDGSNQRCGLLLGGGV